VRGCSLFDLFASCGLFSDAKTPPPQYSSFLTPPSTQDRSKPRLLAATEAADISRSLKGHTAVVCDVAIAADGGLVATASDDKLVKLFSVGGGFIRDLCGHCDSVLRVNFNRDGTRLVSASLDQTARVWDVASGHCVQILAGHSDWVYSAAFSPNGATVATASGDGSVRIWTSDGEFVRAFLHNSAVMAVGWSPCERFVASGGEGGFAVRIWEVKGGHCVGTLQGHSRDVNDVAYSEGGTLASASADKTVRIWRGELCVATLCGHTSMVGGVVWQREGALWSVGLDGSARGWRSEVGGWSCTAVISLAARHLFPCGVDWRGGQLAVTAGKKEVVLLPVRG
jgi:WD40 repeat protein